MNIFLRCGLVAIAAFACAMAGEAIHDGFPVYVSHSGELIKLISSLIGTLFAIVLGLLISSSYTTFNNHQADFNAMATAAANIDLLLKLYPQQSASLRPQLLATIDRVLGRYWPEKSRQRQQDVNYHFLNDDIAAMVNINNTFQAIDHVSRDDINAMRQFSNQFVAIQTNIIRSLSNQVPSLLLVIVFGWACLLFFLYGIFGSGSAFEIFFLFLGAIAIASANFLILELTHPYQGMFKVSSAAFDLLHAAIVAEQQVAREQDR
ncbi:DUF4239 domain-containing protein [Aquitalea magnusonii]|uniref:Uncharacterized protein DUF4239 n=1 Tax=Aquitalea magnusonii TaxID=332411 RepID=A0A318J566_9NEIS|nr:DUF4239 domain-containing protein [Aquitalea magnusonii]PXX41780.1 uncharacterized protein DUF4239 [Aquitalea magnusonii]